VADALPHPADPAIAAQEPRRLQLACSEMSKTSQLGLEPWVEGSRLSVVDIENGKRPMMANRVKSDGDKTVDTLSAAKAAVGLGECRHILDGQVTLVDYPLGQPMLSRWLDRTSFRHRPEITGSTSHRGEPPSHRVDREHDTEISAKDLFCC
jgi:hypothetical protein